MHLMIDHLQWDQTKDSLPGIKVVFFVKLSNKMRQDVFFQEVLKEVQDTLRPGRGRPGGNLDSF